MQQRGRILTGAFESKSAVLPFRAGSVHISTTSLGDRSWITPQGLIVTVANPAAQYIGPTRCNRKRESGCGKFTPQGGRIHARLAALLHWKHSRVQGLDILQRAAMVRQPVICRMSLTRRHSANTQGALNLHDHDFYHQAVDLYFRLSTFPVESSKCLSAVSAFIHYPAENSSTPALKQKSGGRTMVLRRQGHEFE